MKPTVKIQIGERNIITLEPDVITMTPAAAAYWHVFAPKPQITVLGAKKVKP